jgi:hypothetical protein
MFNYIQNIKLSRKLKKKEIENFDLEDVCARLPVAYEDLKIKGLLITNKIRFHNSIYYEVKNENGTISKIKIKSGDAIEIEEFAAGPSYAIVRSIISHKGNDNNEYQFFYITWYNQLKGNDPLLCCSRFELCHENKRNWHTIFPINVVDQQPKIHFVHACSTSSNGCNMGKHDSNIYYKNDYFFHPI